MEKKLSPELVLVTHMSDDKEDLGNFETRGCDPADECGPDYDDCKPNDKVIVK